MISTVTLNPTVDKTVYVTKLVPNDTNRVLRVEIDAGGKGTNCSRMLSRLGVETRAVAFLGGKNGELVRAVLDREGVEVDAVPTERPTRTCIAVEESSGQPPTTLNERGGPIEHKELVSFFERTKDAARTSSFVVFGGSVPSGVNQDVYRVLVQIAAAGGAKAVLDADGEALAEGVKAKPFMIKPNLDEAERLLGRRMQSREDIARGALEIAEQGIQLVVISMGREGALACWEGILYDAVPPAVDVASTIGSGDSLIAGLLSVLERGGPIEQALKVGCAAGAATALSSGADIGEKADVDRLAPKVKITRIEPG